jgi:hypothetical protein
MELFSKRIFAANASAVFVGLTTNITEPFNQMCTYSNLDNGISCNGATPIKKAMSDRQENDGDRNVSVAVCAKALKGPNGFNGSSQVIEFVEYYRAMGIGHITFYNYTTSAHVNCLLDQYEQSVSTPMIIGIRCLRSCITMACNSRESRERE